MGYRCSILYEIGLQLFERAMMLVFVRQYHFVVWQMPVDSEVGVVPSYGTFGFRVIEVVALILEDSRLAEYGKAVCHALW